jgi:hypothetical protein
VDRTAAPESSAIFVSPTFATGTAACCGVLALGIPLFGLEIRIQEMGLIEVGTAHSLAVKIVVCFERYRLSEDGGLEGHL